MQLSGINFQKNKNNLQIDYSDTGVGATVNDVKLRNGLRNVENRIVAINGSVTFDSNSSKGFKTSFTIPL
jgi:signal transduction histidine kinase